MASRLAFWTRWLGPECPYPENREERMRDGRELPSWAVESLPTGKDSIRILDVNAGPATALGNRSEGLQVELVAIDTLGHQYDRLIDAFGLEPPVRTRACSPEDVLATFGKQAFDLIYSCNGLDSVKDPVPVYRQFLECLRPGGRVITFHEAPADAETPVREWHRWFHLVRDGRPVIRQKTYSRDLQDALPEARIKTTMDGGFVRLELKRVHPARVRLRYPASLEAGDSPPKLMSLHIPKAAGSSFRLFLEKIYGPSLRCMYAHHETAPKLLAQVTLDPGIRCLHGHFQADAYMKKLQGAALITWMRDPVERIISSFFQFKRHPETASEFDFNRAVIEEGWSLMDFARHESMRIQLRWYLNAVPLEKFLFIGISEEFDASLKLLCHLLNIEEPARAEHANTNPDKKVTSRYELTQAQRKELEALYSEDIELYRFVRKRFHRQFREAFGNS